MMTIKIKYFIRKNKNNFYQLMMKQILSQPLKKMNLNKTKFNLII